MQPGKLAGMRWTAPLRPLFRASEGFLDRVLCLLGAVAFCQLPEFIQQYLQRLGGHLDEARHQLAVFETTAASPPFNLTLPQYIERTSANSDRAVAQLGPIMQNSLDRVNELASAESALRNASIWERPFVFFANLDRSIASATLDVYKPAVPTTTEGLLYAAAGMIVILCVYHGCVRYPISAALRRRAARRLAA
ncbi:MAG: hypothetical protein K0R17_509 [Rariglobus sp.]|nr:hypothetical protein [Rariglobus sp.]